MDTSRRNEDDIRILFGLRVRKLRQARGLSQETFADESNIDRSYVGGVERGERNISLINIKKIAESLDVSIDRIFKGLYD